MNIKYRAQFLYCRLLVIAFLCFSLVSFYPKSAGADCQSCICIFVMEPLVLREAIRENHDDTRDHVVDEFEDHRNDYMVGYFFSRLLLPNFMLMTEQLVTTAMHQMFILGTFFDAREELEFQRLVQKKTAEAHKDYHPSTGMCTIGTMSRSLAASQRRGELMAHALSERSKDRQLGNRGSVGALARGHDINFRFSQVRSRYCNPQEQAGELTMTCSGTPPVTINKDIDYTRTLDTPLTVGMDPDDTAITDNDEVDIIALGTNLYAHHAPQQIAEALLEREDNQHALLDLRQLLAKRSVAEHSFNTIVGMKTEGSSVAEETGTYMSTIFRQLGLEEEGDIEALLGERPSYHAQMEVLTKKLYQRPAFYTNLYDKPANVLRKGAALRAIGLMQNMDRFKSQIRSEMLLSVMLELDILKEQERVQARLDALGDE